VINRADAEDIVQEAFTRAYRSVNRFRGDSTFLTWLCRIATNRALSRLSLRSLTEEPRAPEQMPHTPSESAEEGACLRRDVAVAMARLPAHLRVTLSLRVHGDLSYAEIAEALNCPIGTVMSRLAEARRLMRVDLADWFREG
jgi:RNA polymerase sigma-70 factor (ECF subfamily)